MTNIISMHSFHHGVGKSIIAVNVACLLAADGWRVGLIDADLQSPSLASFFGLSKVLVPHSLNDYLKGKCDIEQACYDVTVLLKKAIKGRLFLVPAHPFSTETTQTLLQEGDLKQLSDGFLDFIETFSLDVLIVDTHAGIHTEAMTLMAISDTTMIVVRRDLQDLQGVSVLVDVAYRLSIPQVMLIGNELLHSFDLVQMQTQLEDALHCSVAAVLPYCQELVSVSHDDIFVFRYPDHLVTQVFRQIATTLVMPSVPKQAPA